MAAELELDLPWVGASPEDVDGLLVRRGPVDRLAYDDGIVLEVHILDPGRYESAAKVIDEGRAAQGPGRVVLVAGAVPLSWRHRLRDAEVSFVDISGVAEIRWPRLRISARRFGQPIKRQRSPLPLQKGHALVVQELLVGTADGVRPSIGELADSAGVSMPTASKAISQLAAHGLVAKQRDESHVFVEVINQVELAELLAKRTAWPGEELISGYLWGRTVFDVAERISKAAEHAEIDLAVTGRVGAAYHGVLGTSSPQDVRCWVDVGPRQLADVAEVLGLDPAVDDAANVLVCTDRWRTGVHRRRTLHLDDTTATVAHPIRVWCDLGAERRGSEFAAQMWGAVAHGR